MFRKYNFRRADYEAINTDLEGIDWRICDELEINEAVDLYAMIFEAIDKFVPKTLFKKRYPTWNTPELINLLKSKERIRRKWKRTNDDAFYHQYSDLRARLKLLLEENYRRFPVFLRNNIRSNESRCSGPSQRENANPTHSPMKWSMLV